MTTYTGADLLAMGVEQGPRIGQLLATINASPHDREQVQRLVEATRPPPVLTLVEGRDCTFHIEAGTDDERRNVEAVAATVAEVLRTPVAVRGLVMPDACPAGSMGTIPVGGVVTLDNAIAPGMHSADICCSVMMTEFDGVEPPQLLDAIGRLTHFGPGGRGERALDAAALVERLVKRSPLLDTAQIRHAMADHLGTQGDGNHFAFVGTMASTGRTVLVTHHGSRKPGALLYRAGMRIAEGWRQKLSPKTLKQNAWIPADSEDGRVYWSALQAIRAWTEANHRVLHEGVARGTGAQVTDQVWNEHNFVFEQDGLYHHAKGATPVDPAMVPGSDGRMLVPLNMAEPVLVIRGTGTAAFAPHGAGRNMSRSAYKRQLLADGITEAQALAEQTAGIEARWHCGLPDVSELPGAYKSAAAVQEQMQRFGLAEVIDRVRPFGSIMAGDWEHDAPWTRKRRDRRAAGMA